MDILTQFINLYEAAEPDATDFLNTPLDKLQQLEQQAWAATGDVNLALLTPELRQQSARTRPGDVPAMLRVVAAIMGKREARALGTTPAVLIDAADKGVTLCGYLLGTSDLAQAAGDGVLVLGGSLADSCDKVLGTATTMQDDTDLSAEDRTSTRFAFGAAFRLQAEEEKRTSEAIKRGQDQRKPMQQKLQQAQTDTEAGQLLESFLEQARAAKAKAGALPAAHPAKRGHHA